MNALPKKLKKDAVAEAICDIRFESDESKSLPELVVGMLAEFKDWRSFEKARLPISDIPPQLRFQDPALKKQPVLELKDKNHTRLVRIGVNILSYHRVAHYPGWNSFKPEIDRVIDFLFAKLESINATRLGLRYINLFSDEDHKVGSFKDLNYHVMVANERLDQPQYLQFQKSCSDMHLAQIRIASPEFFTGPPHAKASVLLDVDVFTPNNCETSDPEEAKSWVEDAHTFEKVEFFNLFTDEMRKRLIEEL